MSQVLSYENASVFKLSRCIENQRVMASTLADILAAVPETLIVNEQQCVRAEKYMVAPKQLSSILREDFLKINNGSQEISNVKVAALTSIVNSQNNICISDDNLSIIKEKIAGIVCSESVGEVTARSIDLFAAIKRSHAKVFTERVVSIVKDSALSIGFKDVRVSENRIVASNSSGKNLIVEIDCKENAKIDAELIGITDGSCAKVMKEFDNALAARGIVAKKKTQKSKVGQQRVFSDEQVVCNENNKVSIKRI